VAVRVRDQVLELDLERLATLVLEPPLPAALELLELPEGRVDRVEGVLRLGLGRRVPVVPVPSRDGLREGHRLRRAVATGGRPATPLLSSGPQTNFRSGADEVRPVRANRVRRPRRREHPPGIGLDVHHSILGGRECKIR